jgi:peroxiredoxin
MVETPSTMTSLGIEAPAFRLQDPAGKHWSREDFKEARALLVVFMCNHCPFVKHLREHLAATIRDYQELGIAAVAINSNDVSTYPDDSPEKMAEESREFGYTFPYLYDEAQAVAKAYGAACTPDFFLFDGKRRLVYRGQYDDSRPSNGRPVTGRDLRAAMDAVLAGRDITGDQRPSVGCNIKWKSGNEPAWFHR